MLVADIAWGVFWVSLGFLAVAVTVRLIIMLVVLWIIRQAK